MHFADLLDYRAGPQDLAGRHILVTGAGSGIGAAVALDLAGAGATVTLLGRRVPPLESVWDAITAAGGEAAIYPMDLESAAYQDFERLHDTLLEAFGRLDGLLCNAAMLGDLTPLARYQPQTWARVHQVNLHAPFMMLQNLLPALLASEDASIAFTLDAAVRPPRPYRGAYGTSKAALEAMLHMLAEETAHYGQLRCNGLCPPPVLTQLRRDAYPGEDPAALASPDSITGPFLWLLGPAGRACRGEILA